jgi:ABC-2 type transport system permease protein
MYSLRWFRHSVQIARTERTRSRRQLGRSSTWRAVIALVLVGLSIAVGGSAYAIGHGLSRGELTLPLGIMQAATTVIIVLSLTTVTHRASVRFERVDFDHLLTTVPPRDVVLGVAGFLYSQFAVLLALPVGSLAVGFALGRRAPKSALTIVVTIGALLALIVVASVTLSLTGEYLALRSPRFRRYRTIIVYSPLVLVWLIVTGPLVPLSRLVVWFQLVPLAWFVDLALIGAPGVRSGLLRSVGAMCLLAGGLPGLTVAATALGERVWGADAISATAIHRSRSLVGDGLAERVFAGWISRPVLTVARKRWVQECRVPRAFMMIAALLLCIGSGVGVYALSPAPTPAVTPLLIAFACAIGSGLGFGEYVLAAEYPSVPMTLTTVSGSHFIRGTLLAGLVIGVPLTTVLTVAAGVVSPVGALELVLVTIVGVLLCGCSVTVAMALGMQFTYTEFLLLPITLPLSSVRRIYGRMGKAPLLSVGTAIGVIGLISLPAFVSYLSVVTEPLAMTLGITPATVRIGALVVTMSLAVVVSVLAYRRAVTRFNEYSLP